MREIFYDIRSFFNSTFLIDWLKCTEGGTDDSLSSSDDLFNFLDFSFTCATKPH